MPVSGADHGDTIQIKVKHPGSDNWTSDSITTDPAATCTDGIPSIQDASTVVDNGYVSFYTCSASSFAVVQ